MADMTPEDQQMLMEYLNRQSVDPNAPAHDLMSQYPQLAQAPVTSSGDFDFGGGQPNQSVDPSMSAPPPSAAPTPTPAPTPQAAPASAPQAQSMPQSSNPLPTNIGQVVGPQYSDAARQDLYARLQASRSSPGALIGQALAGFGDSLNNAYGTGAQTHALQNTIGEEQAMRNTALDQFNQGRNENIQNFDQNLKLKQGAREDQAFQLTGQQLAMNRDPNSDVSTSKQALLAKYTGQPVATYKGMSGEQIDKILPTSEKAYGVDSRNKMIEAIRNSTSGTRADQQQDKLESQARTALTSLRGDKSLQNAETQRDAAISAYNRINEVQQSGQALNPIDYIDVLGQIYKARTGSAPTNEVLNSAHQATLKGDLGKAYTFMTGQQAPATTQDIMNSLKGMAASMGTQADKFHDAYMQTHLIKPSGLSNDRWQPIAQTTRGTSFADATGIQPGQSGASTQFSPDVVKYAQTHGITAQQAQAIKQQRGGQ